MSIMRIKGGNRLYGDIRVQGAKNSVLPIMAAAILNRGETVIRNCPSLSDVEAAMRILRHLGCHAEKKGDTVRIDASNMTGCDIPDVLMREMRSSVIFLGAILARCGQAVLSLPGGCELGPRPIDLHLDAMRALGVEIDERGGNLLCHATALRGTRIELSIPSVGATENSMIAAAGCSGRTTIVNAAREPEIRDLAQFLMELGVGVSGAGTSIITVEPGEMARFVEHRVIPDRIAAATFMAATVAAKGKVELLDIIPSDMNAIISVFTDMGARIETHNNRIIIEAEDTLNAPKPIVTRPFPGFPTDAQPPLMSACLTCSGTSVFVETIFENRYRHVPELQRMGAEIRLDGRVAMISGVSRLQGTAVSATDLRGGAALCVAALAAAGETEISRINHIERGYENLERTLGSLGADIRIT